MSARTFTPPVWRIASRHSIGPPNDRDNLYFHACGDDAHLLCDPFLFLAASAAEANEGSRFCPECMTIARGR